MREASVRVPRVVVALAVLALAARGAAVWAWQDELLVDRDAYLGIARQLADGNGFADANTGRPTAFRPPLYPLALAALAKVLNWPAAVAGLNLLAGTATVILTWLLGRRLLPDWAAGIAALLVAVDPLLVRYVSQPMTECLCTALVTWFVLLTVNGGGTCERVDADMPRRTLWPRELLCGFAFGLAVLCRPTLLAAVPVYVAIQLVLRVTGRSRWREAIDVRRWAVTAAGAALVLSPWAIRNAVVLGRPTVTTTHGGYTLLLGNNPVYYEEVVSQPAGTVWDGESLGRWQASLEAAMAQSTPPVVTEFERDRWMYDRALSNIREAPEQFLRACLLRCRRFWGLAPTGPAADAAGGPLRAGIAAFYFAVLVSALAGLVRLRGGEWKMWQPLLIVAASFWLVHLFFWTDTRMRAPIVPIVAVLAARAFCGWKPTSTRG